ncbi:uncharacterized protein C6orf118-like [Colossoma macropomum]|uniref:uncharacterized protein C6orf118-like n=1 Tax=Colossoma macropomum TaxID=42526 RepID=UPI001865157B|nr:uncharacterized protein C6orf118-like [Colossoma macropomum]
MSVSGGQRLRPSDIRRERKELLLCVERGNKADIHTYSSGHLGPYSFNPRPVYCRRDKPIWEKSKHSESKHSGLSRLQESRAQEDSVKEMVDALYNFTMATTLQEPDVRSSTGSPSSPPRVDPYRTRENLDTTELFLVKPSSLKPGPCAPTVEVDQGRYWFTRSYLAGLTCSDQLLLWKRFDRQVVRKQDLITRNCLSGIEAAQRHQRKLQQELRKVPACRGPCLERLAVFSDVFGDVCDGSPAFGSVLGEIKMEYDLYLNSVVSSQSTFQLTAAFLPSGVVSGSGELEEAEQQVSSLEEKARRALEENDRVRAEYEDMLAKDMENQQEEVRGSEGSGQCGLTAVEEGLFPDVKQSEAEVSSMAQVESKRQEVWSVWKEVQRLQKEIRETMVSTVTTSSLEGSIQDTKAEVMRLIASSGNLRSTIKDLEENISKVLHRAKVGEETKALVWEKIWATVNRDE